MTRTYNPGWQGRAVIAAAALLLCVPLLGAHGERRGEGPRQGGMDRSGRLYAPIRRGAMAPYPGPPYLSDRARRPAYRGYPAPADAPRGHLGDWLNRHRNLSAPQQEQMLRSDPGFQQLPPGEQARLMQQLRRVDRMTPAEQERRAARVEMLEHMSPQERMQVSLAARRWTTLPVERQALMKRAFHQLRAVPPDQRDTVLNSARFEAAFSPEERQILSDLLLVEPYQPAPYPPAQ